MLEMQRVFFDRIIEDKYACVKGVWLDISIRPRNQLTVKKKKIQDRTGFEPMTSAMLLQWFRRILSSNVLFTLVFILRFVS